MKFEKISENQIRCTLSRADLADRELMITELAYGTEKARSLFREMMQQASYELGFEAEDIPLMIEAVPVSPDCLVLIITKVEDPEELDTRFSKFTRPKAIEIEEEPQEDYDEEEEEEDNVATIYDQDSLSFSTDDVSAASGNIDLFSPISQAIEHAKELAKKNAMAGKDHSSEPIIRIFYFHDLAEIMHAATIIKPAGTLSNSLYKNKKKNAYYLVLAHTQKDTSDFSKICSQLLEYSKGVTHTYASLAHYDEHFVLMIKNNALQTLAKI